MPVYKGYKLFNVASCICKRKIPGRRKLFEVEVNTFCSGCVRGKKINK